MENFCVYLLVAMGFQLIHLTVVMSAPLFRQVIWYGMEKQGASYLMYHTVSVFTNLVLTGLIGMWWGILGVVVAYIPVTIFTLCLLTKQGRALRRGESIWPWSQI